MNQSTLTPALRLRARTFDGDTIETPDDVRKLHKKKHWVAGRSAFETAHSWVYADGTPSGIPAGVAAILAGAPEWAGATMTAGVFEHATKLDSSIGKSMSDVMVLCQLRDGPAVLCVEGKSGERFDLLVSEWLGKASPESGKRDRLTWTCEKLGIKDEGCEDLYWQLFHRTASAILKAKDIHAGHAIMLVHDFTAGRLEPDGTVADDHFADFENFAKHIGFTGMAHNAITPARVIEGVSLRLAWVSDTPQPKPV